MAPSDEAMTDTQRSVLEYVQKHLQESHRSPTVREVMRHFTPLKAPASIY